MNFRKYSNKTLALWDKGIATVTGIHIRTDIPFIRRITKPINNLILRFLGQTIFIQSGRYPYSLFLLTLLLSPLCFFLHLITLFSLQRNQRCSPSVKEVIKARKIIHSPLFALHRRKAAYFFLQLLLRKEEGTFMLLFFQQLLLCFPKETKTIEVSG